MKDRKRPLVTVDSDDYSDTLLVCKNGFQSCGVGINEEIATEAIKVLKKYLYKKKCEKRDSSQNQVEDIEFGPI